MSSGIYTTSDGEKEIKEFYNRQVKNLKLDCEDIYVDTRFGKTHVLKSGRKDAKPILFFHRNNGTAAHSLKQNEGLLKDYLVYAVDTIGQPGKSEQRILSHKTHEYGQWASDVIDSLGFSQVACMGESFGGGILTKLMCVAPEKISKAVLFVPAGFKNVSKKFLIKMSISKLLYTTTKKDTYLEKALNAMVNDTENIDQNTLDMNRLCFDYVKTNMQFPNKVKAKECKTFNSPILLFAGKKDPVFPAEKVVKRAKKLFPNVEAHLLKDCSHFYSLSEKRNAYIKERVDNFLSN
ncbi:alpha/beta fold hydrolase [Proteinivorax hydrogeniformans]|uniref:Alpha/beta fold hydrolase n=1 Tax=Proteinivorax hydrogeniformans TaxID=1826727 RepID=A0AAU8HSY7_9FIRM